MTDTEDKLRVEAGADKALFVSMLVKDIELLPAVIDLVDNSVDGARATTPADLSSHHVSITVTPDRFVIADDCGGIDLDVARHYAFRFGRPKEYQGVAGSVGQFGVGMKRALFKLGTRFTVESRAAHSAFVLPVDVDEWAADPSPDWQFRMATADAEYDPAAGGGTGTTITVDRLHDSVAEDLSNPLVLGQLREQIRLRHQAVLQQNLEIKLNDEALTGFAPALLSGHGFAPVNRRFVVTGRDGGEVHCRLVAGLAAGDDDNRDEGQAEDFRSAGDAGWWLFCNNRLLLFAERSSLTGWGDSTAAYHPQYRRFRGYVYLTALDTSLLPWNTTKTGVDQDSRVWRQVQTHMKTALGQMVAVINRLKTERQRGEEPEDMPVTAAVSGATAVPLDELPMNASVVAPSPRPMPATPRPRPSAQRIQYSVDRGRYQEVANILEVTIVSEVGRLTRRFTLTRLPPGGRG